MPMDEKKVYQEALPKADEECSTKTETPMSAGRKAREQVLLEGGGGASVVTETPMSAARKAREQVLLESRGFFCPKEETTSSVVDDQISPQSSTTSSHTEFSKLFNLDKTMKKPDSNATHGRRPLFGLR